MPPRTPNSAPSPLPSIAVSSAAVPGYALLDSGNRYKLEQFGPVTVIRGEPKAWWAPALPPAEWDRAQALHEEGQGWKIAPGCPRQWTFPVDNLTFRLKFSDSSKHLGLFPEQAPHWDLIRRAGAAARAAGEPPPRLLNLFGYTGAATLAAAAAGWLPTHVDASKPAIAWARENQSLSHLDDVPIRWILEDATKYVRRELNRGSQYEGILLDPPAFGRGPSGGVWKVEHHLPELLALCRDLLSPRARLLILTTYNIEASSLMLLDLLRDLFPSPDVRLAAGELVLPHSSSPSRLLPLSIYATMSRL